MHFKPLVTQIQYQFLLEDRELFVTDKFSRKALKLWSIVGTPASFAVFVECAYHYKRSLPHTIQAEWVWGLVFGTCLLSGFVAMLSVLQKGWPRITLGIAYIIVMTACMFYIGLMIACLNGDCI